MPEDGQKMPSGFLVANHGNGFRAVRELQRADLWEAACYFAYPNKHPRDIHALPQPLFVVNAVKWERRACKIVLPSRRPNCRFAGSGCATIPRRSSAAFSCVE